MIHTPCKARAIALLLVCCRFAFSVPSPTQNVVHFRDSSPVFYLDANTELDVRLNPHGHIPLPEYSGFGIYPLSKDVAFIYGTLETPGWAVRSLLLRSEDGGTTWREVDMVPEKGSCVTELIFIDDRTGWAATQFTVEGAGDVYLFGTADSGKTWEKRSLLLKPAANSQIVRMTFYDAKHGQIVILHDAVSASSDGIEVKETSDGGRTWTSVFRLRIGLLEGMRYNEIGKPGTSIGGIVEEINRQLDEQLGHAPRPASVAPDGSQWRMVVYVVDKDGTRRILEPQGFRSRGAGFLAVQRRLNENDGWEERALLPEDYRLKSDASVPEPISHP